MESDMIFGIEIKRIRKSKDMTIKQLSEKSALSASYISQIETGKRDTPTPKSIKKIAYGLDTDYYKLLRIAGYLKESNFITLEQIIQSIPNEEKIDTLIQDAKKEQMNNDDKLTKFVNEKVNNKIEYLSDFRNLSQEYINDSFKSYLHFRGHAGEHLKYLRLFNNITLDEMAKFLDMKKDTYSSLEETSRTDSQFIVNNSEKLGDILNVEDFLTWYNFVNHQDTMQSLVLSNKESEYKEICFDMKSIEKKVNKDGSEYFIEYTEEELKRNLFNIDYLLNQNNHKVSYKDRVLTNDDIKRLKSMLEILFE